MTAAASAPSVPPTPVKSEVRRVLLVGATGFVGRRLMPVLQRAGFTVIGTSRNQEAAQARFPGIEFRAMDVTDVTSTRRAMRGCDAAVYLVHSMADSREYADVEQRSATTFRDAASDSRLMRIVYLGGIRPSGEISPHLESRLRTGEILRSGNIPTIELQATMIIGGGGESWRMVRDLAARLPFMLLPRWLDSETEPVAVDDVTAAIAHALRLPLEESRTYTLPGPERLAAREILRRTARLLGSNPRMVRVPLVTPKLSSYWIRLVTRADHHVAEQLVQGLRSDILSTGDNDLWRLMPEHRRVPFDEAARRALGEEEQSLSLLARLTERVVRSAPGGRKATRTA